MSGAVAIAIAFMTSASATALAQRPVCPADAEPVAAAAHVARARVALGGRNADGAVRELRAAVRLDPCAAPLHVALGDALFLGGREDLAETSWSLALRIDGRDESARQRVVGESSWYGWQVLLVDLLAVGVFTLGAAAAVDSRDADAVDFVPIAGLATYLFGSPLLHLGQGNDLEAVGALALRVGVPFGIFGAAGRNPLGVLGAMFGVFIATFLDVAWLARTRPEPRRPAWPVPEPRDALL